MSLPAVAREIEMLEKFFSISNTSNPAASSRAETVSGSTVTSVSPIWIIRICQLCRLSLPTKNSSRFEHPPYLSEEPILQCGRRHVVQHSERNDSGELFIGEGQFGGIADYDTNIAAVQTCG